MARHYSGVDNTPIPGYMTAYSNDPDRREKAIKWIMDADNPENSYEWVRPLNPGERTNSLSPDIMQLLQQSILRGG